MFLSYREIRKTKILLRNFIRIVIPDKVLIQGSQLPYQILMSMINIK